LKHAPDEEVAWEGKLGKWRESGISEEGGECILKSAQVGGAAPLEKEELEDVKKWK